MLVLNNIMAMENKRKFDVLGFVQKELNCVFAVKIREVGFRKFVTDGEAKEIGRNNEWIFVHVKKGTFIRIIEKGNKNSANGKKKITYIVTPKVNPSTVKMYVQTLAEF